MQKISIGAGIDLSAIQKPAEGSPEAEAEGTDMPQIDDFDQMMDIVGRDNLRSQFGPPPPPPLTKEETVQKRRAIMKIRRYYDRFGSCLPPMPHLETMDIPDLENLLEDTKFMVANKNTGQAVEKSFQAVAYCVEQLGPTLNLKLQGFGDAIASQEHIKDLLFECSLENERLIYVRPEYRLLYCCGITAMGVHQMNKMRDVTNEFLDEEIGEDLEEEYKDL